MRHYLIPLLLSVFPSMFLSGCSKAPASPDSRFATIEITEIVDKSSGSAIENNTIILRSETLDGEVIDTKEYKNLASLVTELRADGSVRLFITVTAPGYEPWENAIRLNLENDKIIYIEVEMEKEGTSRLLPPRSNARSARATRKSL